MMEIFCEETWLNHRTLCTARKVKTQLLDEMKSMGLPTREGTTAFRHASNMSVLKSVVAACLLPNLLQHLPQILHIVMLEALDVTPAQGNAGEETFAYSVVDDKQISSFSKRGDG